MSADRGRDLSPLKIKYLRTGHGDVVARNGTVSDYFDDARGSFVREDCMVRIEREPPPLDYLLAAGELRFSSVAPIPQTPLKRPREEEREALTGPWGKHERAGSAASTGSRKRRHVGSRREEPKACDPDRPIQSREVGDDEDGENAIDASAPRVIVAVADSQIENMTCELFRLLWKWLLKPAYRSKLSLFSSIQQANNSTSVSRHLL